MGGMEFASDDWVDTLLREYKVADDAVCAAFRDLCAVCRDIDTTDVTFVLNLPIFKELIGDDQGGVRFIEAARGRANAIKEDHRLIQEQVKTVHRKQRFDTKARTFTAASLQRATLCQLNTVALEKGVDKERLVYQTSRSSVAYNECPEVLKVQCLKQAILG